MKLLSKRIYTILAVAAVAASCLTVASCAKDEPQQGKTKAPVFRATAEAVSEQGSKVQYNGEQFLWQADDTVRIYDGLGFGMRSTYVINPSYVGTSTAVFNFVSGTEPSTSPYTFLYPAQMWMDKSTVDLPQVQRTPDGRLQGMPLHGVSDNTQFSTHHVCGVVRFRLQASSSVSISRIAVATNHIINGAATVSGSGSSLSLSTPNGNKVTTLSCDVAQSIASSHDFYMYLPAGSYSTFRILMTAADGSTCLKTANIAITVQRAKITTITLTGLTFTEHRFSTSASTSVVFSPGNLQYIGSAATPYWRFAERQYDYFGSTTGQGSNSPDKDRDLFGWGTSGWNSGNTYYRPYDTEKSSSSNSKYGPSGSYNLKGVFSNADWGVYNAVRNGGNAAGQWRTLTGDEWLFLCSSDRPVATRYVKAIVAGTSGLIMFPDVYSHPAGLTALANVNLGSAAYNTNQYTASEWLQMEAAGAIFLPAAGYRYGADFLAIGNEGRYWSSSHSGTMQAYQCNIQPSTLVSYTYYPRSTGLSVRLVRD